MTPAFNSVDLAPSPTAANDSPIAMITISPWRSTKCAGCTRKPPTPRKRGATRPISSATSQRSGFDQPCAKPAATINAARYCRRCDPQDRRQQVVVPARRELVEKELHQRHEEERDTEYDAVPAERLGHGEGGDEHRRHCTQHRPPDATCVRVGDVRQPGIRGPRPPERPENQQCVGEPVPRRVARENRRDLRERENEHEVEEELERGYALLALELLRAHTWTLTPSPRRRI